VAVVIAQNQNDEKTRRRRRRRRRRRPGKEFVRERERELCYTYRVWKRSFKAR